MMKILDACCGGKMFWYERHEPHTTYLDIRKGTFEFKDCGHTRKIEIDPDVVGDFRDLPFSNEEFDLVIFDPPHLIRAGEKSWLRAKYGVLPEDWRSYLHKGFLECMRVLKPDGILLFKWSNSQIDFKKVMSVCPYDPIFGDKRGKRRWYVFLNTSDLPF